MFVINKINIDSSFNTLINIKMTTYIYEAQNNLNLVKNITILVYKPIQ